MLACFYIAILAVGSAGEIITNAIDEENKIKVPGRMRDLQAGIPVNPPWDDVPGQNSSSLALLAG